MNLNEIYQEMGIDNDVYAYGQKITEELKGRFAAIDETAEYNQLKVLHAMQKNRVSDIHFAATSGYGYNDLGRDTLEAVPSMRRQAWSVRRSPVVPMRWPLHWLPTFGRETGFWLFPESHMIRWRK